MIVQGACQVAFGPWVDSLLINRRWPSIASEASPRDAVGAGRLRSVHGERAWRAEAISASPPSRPHAGQRREAINRTGCIRAQHEDKAQRQTHFQTSAVRQGTPRMRRTDTPPCMTRPGAPLTARRRTFPRPLAHVRPAPPRRPRSYEQQATTTPTGPGKPGNTCPSLHLRAGGTDRRARLARSAGLRRPAADESAGLAGSGRRRGPLPRVGLGGSTLGSRGRGDVPGRKPGNEWRRAVLSEMMGGSRTASRDGGVRTGRSPASQGGVAGCHGSRSARSSSVCGCRSATRPSACNVGYITLPPAPSFYSNLIPPNSHPSPLPSTTPLRIHGRSRSWNSFDTASNSALHEEP